MTTKMILGVSLATVLTMVIAFPIVADAITGIEETKIKVKNDQIKKLAFLLEDDVPTQPFGGYAIFTDGGAVIAVTSHAGFYDSTEQTAPSLAQIALDVGPGPAAVCNVTDVACGSEWHVHLVEPANPLDEDGNPICSFAAVGELTHNEPSDSLKIREESIVAKGIAIGTESFDEAIGGNNRDFTVGTPLEGGAAFDLVPSLADPDDLSTLQAVCIVPTAGDDDDDDDNDD